MGRGIRDVYIAWRRGRDLTEDEKRELIYFCEFDIKLENNKYKLIDMQGANLNNIMDEEFDTLDQVLDRIGTPYLWDYFVRSGEVAENEI